MIAPGSSGARERRPSGAGTGLVAGRTILVKALLDMRKEADPDLPLLLKTRELRSQLDRE